MQRVGVKGIHIAERDTQRARDPKPRGRVRQHVVGRGLRLGRPAAGRARLGHPREAHAGQRPSARFRLRRRDLPDAAGRRHPRALLDADAQARTRLPGDPQRVDLDRRLLHGARERQGRSTGRPATTPTTRATTRCCRCTRWPAPPGSGSRSGRSWTSTRSSTASTSSASCSTATRKNAYWYGSPALDRGDAQARALPERHRPAGHLGGAGRHRLDAGEPGPRPRRGRRAGLPALPRDPAALSRAGRRRLHRLDAAHRTAPGLFPEDVDTSDPWQFKNVLVGDLQRNLMRRDLGGAAGAQASAVCLCRHRRASQPEKQQRRRNVQLARGRACRRDETFVSNS